MCSRRRTLSISERQSLSTMSNKRTSTESNNDEQANEGTKSLFQQTNDVKRAKLDSPSHTTLQDLPLELFELILVQAVAMEVQDLKLVKSVWKEKAELVINRLRPVCSQWSSNLTTNFFRNELHKILDGTDEGTIRLKITSDVSSRSTIRSFTTTDDAIFTLERLYNNDHAIYVYHCNTDVVDVILLQDSVPACMAACNVANCLYVGLRSKTCRCLSVFRISRKADHKFHMSPWIQDHKGCISMMSVSSNGNLIILSVRLRCPDVVSIYNANGSLQHEIMLSSDTDTFVYSSVIQKSNGSVVLAYVTEQNPQTQLLEIDTGGSVVRQYQSSMRKASYVNFADVHDRIMITDQRGGIELLDSEFNLLGTYNLLQNGAQYHHLEELRYAKLSSDLNDIVCVRSRAHVSMIFNFEEE